MNFFSRDTMAHLTTSLVIGGLFSLLTYPFLHNPAAVIFFIGLSILIPLIYRPLFSRVRMLLSKTKLGKEGQDGDQTIEKIRETTYTYDDLARNMVKSLLNTFPIEMAAVYFYDLSRKQLVLKAQQGMKNPLSNNLRYNRSLLAIPASDSLMEFIGHKKTLIIHDMLSDESNKGELIGGVLDSLAKIEAEICAPFLFAGTVKGILVISRKKDNKIFNQEDLDALYAFARMGEEVMRYIMGMETELQHTALYSHDMNNDTKSLVQTLEFLQSPLSQSTPREKINELLNQAKDVADRLNQTFQMNRDRSSLIMKSIRGEYEKIPVDITKLARSSVGKFKLLVENEGVQLISKISDKPAIVSGYADDLIRVVDNLLANALRYAPRENGWIQVGGQETANNFIITVKDNGQGINQDDIERIWEMGWQVKNAKQGASGFGLSIARQIVHLHGGSISVESEGQSKGTKFTITLPLLTQEKQG